MHRPPPRPAVRPLDPEHVALMRHALGLPNTSRCSYRNRFLAGGDCADAWRELARRGLARQGAGTPIGDWYSLTLAGAELALLAGEKLDHEDFPQHQAAPL